MIFSLRNEFATLLAETDFLLDENLVRAAVRAYIKARIRVLKTQNNPHLRARHIKTKREQAKRYRAKGYANTRGYDTVLKPARTRKRVIAAIARRKEVEISIRRY